jgi:uncharacterized membrane protein
MAEISAGEWFQNAFTRPILDQSAAGYNIINTVVYGLIFALAVFCVYKFLQRLKIKIDKGFLIGIIPFIVMGAVFRVVRDANIYDTWILVTPVIYIFIFVVAVSTLFLSIGLEKLAKRKMEKWSLIKMALSKKESELLYRRPDKRLMKFLSDYHKIWAVMGITAVFSGLFLLVPVGIKSWFGIGLILGITAIWCTILFLVYKFSHKLKASHIFTKENTAILGVHLFDATTTFVALQYFNYYEQHVVSSAAISLIGPLAQFVLKTIVVVTVLWALDKYLKGSENENLRNFLKIAIIILGLAPGLRNFTRLGLGV